SIISVWIPSSLVNLFLLCDKLNDVVQYQSSVSIFVDLISNSNPLLRMDPIFFNILPIPVVIDIGWSRSKSLVTRLYQSKENVILFKNVKSRPIFVALFFSHFKSGLNNLDSAEPGFPL